jgi:serine/threonine protein phosphatase 1
MVPDVQSNVLHLPANEDGRDFIIGDLHGCYDELLAAMIYVKFNYEKDRMLCVGDLIDRGRKSYECLKLLDNPWFYSTLGNHEEMMYESLMTGDPELIKQWRKYGGNWAWDWNFVATVDRRQLVLKYIQKLPLIITVGEGKDRYNILHAELHDSLTPITDENIDKWEWKSNPLYIRERLLWSRAMIEGKLYYKAHEIQKGLSITYCGHTVQDEVVRKGAQVYIDTGIVFGDHLTMVEHKTQKLIKYYPIGERFVESYLTDVVDRDLIRWMATNG